MWKPLHLQPSAFTKRKRRKQEQPPFPSFLMPHPDLNKVKPELHKIGPLEIGHSSIQGYRVSMEDDHIVAKLGGLEDHVLVGVFDGHSGDFTAKFVANKLHHIIEATKEWKDYLKLDTKSRAKKGPELLSRALVTAYLNLDEELRAILVKDGKVEFSGCAAVCALVTPSHVICANVGDSRCVINTIEKTIDMTQDHKPEDDEESKRIHKAGGFVADNRVNGELAMSRALGDFQYKINPELTHADHLVIALPDISVHERKHDNDELMILACDGVWDVLSNADAAGFVSHFVRNGHSLEDEVDPKTRTFKTALEAADELIEYAFSLGSTDNISSLIVKFPAIHR